MAKKKKRQGRDKAQPQSGWKDEGSAFNNPFAALGKKSSSDESAPETNQPSAPKPTSKPQLWPQTRAQPKPQPKPQARTKPKPKPKPKPTPAGATPNRAVVRLERKGRGGKGVTLVTHLGLSEAELAKWCKTLRSKLGCGGAVEGDDIMIQGDQRDRVIAHLEAMGVRRVTRG